MQPYTVWLMPGGDGPPHIHLPTAVDEEAAYLTAANDQEMYDALTYDLGQPKKLTLEQAMVTWPLLMVAKGHFKIEPTLTTEGLHKLIRERREQERKAS